MSKHQQPAATTQWVNLLCGWCGYKGGQYLGHYSVVRCVCGKMFWALQPARGGALVVFPWPGNTPVREQKIRIPFTV